METLIAVMTETKGKEEIERTYSNETFYTDSSEDFRSKCKSAANLLQKRRQLPLLGAGNPYRSASNYGARFITISSPSKSTMNGYSRKITSAKLLRVKQLQNELTDAQFQLNELSTENKLLKTLQKRQDRALSKYEDTKAELPQLIRSHHEEVRVLRSKVKQLKSQCFEKDHRIKELDADLQNLRDQHRHLLKLSRDRHLGEREQLTRQVEDLQEVIKEQDIRLQTLNRRVLLETKNYKHQLGSEMRRHKETERDLNEAMNRVSKLEVMVETKEKYISNFAPKQNFRKNNKQSVSLVSLTGSSRFTDLHTTTRSEVQLIPELDEESSDRTLMASQTNTSFHAMQEDPDTLHMMSEHKMPSDGYNARRMKLANKRKALYSNKSLDLITNKTNDLISSSGLTSPTHSSSSVLNDDRDFDLVDDNANKPPFSFGTTFSSRKSSLNTETSKKLSLHEEKEEPVANSRVNKPKQRQDLIRSNSADSLKEENRSSSSRIKTSRRGSFQENGKKDLFANLMDEIANENGLRTNSLLSAELKSIIEGGLREEILGSKSRRGSLARENKNSVEESMPDITSKNSSRRASLKRDIRSLDEEAIRVVTNRISCRKGSLKQEQCKTADEETIPALTNKSYSRKGSLNRILAEKGLKAAVDSKLDSLNFKNSLDMEHVKIVTSNTEENERAPSDEDETHTGEFKFENASEHLTEISQTWNKIQNIIETETEKTNSKLKQLVRDSEAPVKENKSYEKDKLLAALRAIDDGEDPTVVASKDSSILDSLINKSSTEPGQSSNISLPFLGRITVLDPKWDGSVPIEESSLLDRPKTKTELMQELFGVHSSDFNAQNNNNH